MYLFLAPLHYHHLSDLVSAGLVLISSYLEHPLPLSTTCLLKLTSTFHISIKLVEQAVKFSLPQSTTLPSWKCQPQLSFLLVLVSHLTWLEPPLVIGWFVLTFVLTPKKAYNFCWLCVPIGMIVLHYLKWEDDHCVSAPWLFWLMYYIIFFGCLGLYTCAQHIGLILLCCLVCSMGQSSGLSPSLNLVVKYFGGAYCSASSLNILCWTHGTQWKKILHTLRIPPTESYLVLLLCQQRWGSESYMSFLFLPRDSGRWWCLITPKDIQLNGCQWPGSNFWVRWLTSKRVEGLAGRSWKGI